MLNSLENGKCYSICSYNHSDNRHQLSFPLLHPIFIFFFDLPTCLQNHPYNPFWHPYIPTKNFFLYSQLSKSIYLISILAFSYA